VKWLIATIILCLALAGTVSGAEQATNNSSGCVGCDSDSVNVTENQTITHIFIQEGAGGSFVNDGSGNYTLTMTDVVPYTIFFADRPARDVGLAPMDKFLKGFNFGASNPPNAAIILPDENETSDMVVVELTNPQYNNTTKTLTYNARQLKEYSFDSVWFQDQLSKVDASIPERFDHVVLVIDDCSCQCVGKGAGCDATYARNSCWNWHKFECNPCGGCCSTKSGSCPSVGQPKSMPSVEHPVEHPIKGPIKTPEGPLK
jgi:hypothetical protein